MFWVNRNLMSVNALPCKLGWKVLMATLQYLTTMNIIFHLSLTWWLIQSCSTLSNFSIYRVYLFASLSPYSKGIITILSTHQSTHLSTHLYNNLSTHLSIHLYTHLYNNLSTHLYNNLYTHLYNNLYTHLYNNLYTHLSIHPIYSSYLHILSMHPIPSNYPLTLSNHPTH